MDHFHLVQLANQAVTEVRRRVTVQVRGRRGRKGMSAGRVDEGHRHVNADPFEAVARLARTRR